MNDLNNEELCKDFGETCAWIRAYLAKPLCTLNSTASSLNRNNLLGGVLMIQRLLVVFQALSLLLLAPAATVVQRQPNLQSTSRCGPRSPKLSLASLWFGRGYRLQLTLYLKKIMKERLIIYFGQKLGSSCIIRRPVECHESPTKSLRTISKTNTCAEFLNIESLVRGALIHLSKHAEQLMKSNPHSRQKTSTTAPRLVAQSERQAFQIYKRCEPTALRHHGKRTRRN